MGRFKKIKMLELSEECKGDLEDYMYNQGKINQKKEAIKESVEHQILSEYTAFVCIGKDSK
jgi:hypothetical protein